MTRMVQLGGQLVNLDGIQAPHLVQANETSSTDLAPVAVTVTPSATAHTKGSWVKILTTTAAADVIMLRAGATFASGASGLALLDLGVGASGSQTVLVSNLCVGNASSLATGGGQGIPLLVPIRIASGVDLWARVQSARASAPAISVEASLGAWDGFRSPASIDTLTANAATSGGTTVTADNTWTSAVAAAAREYQGFLVGLATSDTAIAGTGAIGCHLRIGGTDVHVVPSLVIGTPTEQLLSLRPGWGGAFVRAHCLEGASIEVLTNGVAAATANPMHVVLHGIPMLYPQ